MSYSSIEVDIITIKNYFNTNKYNSIVNKRELDSMNTFINKINSSTFLYK